MAESESRPAADEQVEKTSKLKAEIVRLKAERNTLREKLDRLIEDNAVLHARTVQMEGELDRRRESHPIIQRKGRYRNPDADRQTMITMWAGHFARILCISPGMILGTLRHQVADAVNATYPSMVRSAARALVEGRVAGLSRIGHIPAHLIDLTENTLTMLDVLETVVHHYGAGTPVLEPPTELQTTNEPNAV